MLYGGHQCNAIGLLFLFRYGSGLIERSLSIVESLAHFHIQSIDVMLSQYLLDGVNLAHRGIFVRFDAYMSNRLVFVHGKLA